METSGQKGPPRIETDRLIIRPPMAADLDSVFERYASDRQVTRYLSFPTHRSLDDTRAFLSFSEAEWTKWPAGPYLIFSRADGIQVGSTGFSFETPYRAMTGYALARDSWGKGYATEATRAIVAVAPTLGIRRLYALCHTDHLASCRVLEKCGFECEGVLHRHTLFPNLDPPQPCDVFCYALVFDGVRS